MTVRAEFARRDITPALGTPSGLTLREAVDEVWDPLTATALVLESGTTRLALVGLDLMGVLEASHRRIREAVTRATGIPDEHVVINVSHTHSAPYLSDDLQAILAPHRLRVQDDDYADLVVERVAEAVAEAAASSTRSPASGVAGDGSSGLRRIAGRVTPADGWCTATAAPRNFVRSPRASSTPRSRWSLDGEEADRSPRFVYACHPTAAGSGTQPTSRQTSSAGRERWRRPPAGCPACTFRAAPATRAPANGSPAHRPTTRRRWASGSRRGSRKRCPPRARRPMRSKSRARRSPLEFDPFPPRERRGRPRRGGPRRLRPDHRARRRAGGRPASTSSGERGSPPWRSARSRIVILPGEVFVEHGLRIRSRSPFRETIVAAYNDNTLQYIPTAAAFSEGSYEVDGGWRYVRAGEGERIADAAIRLLETLRG